MSAEKQLFTYQQALESFPRVRDRTHAAIRQIEALYNQIHSQEEHEERKQELESAIETIVSEWVHAVTAMGCEVKGLWLVDWDNGDGYYCWKYPEESLRFCHSYEDGFAGRVPIS